MKLSLFDSFADMIENIPTGAIVRTLEREQRMLQEDLFFQRPVSFKEAESILNFCRFVDAACEELPVVFTAQLPAGHLWFYRKVLDRLVSAGELPFDAPTEFDRMLSGDPLMALHHAC